MDTFITFYSVVGILFIVAGLLTLLATCLKKRVEGFSEEHVVVDDKQTEDKVLLRCNECLLVDK